MSSRNKRSRVSPKGGLRRAALLMLGAIVLPGSPQFLAGRRVLGIVFMALTVLGWLTLIVVWFQFRPNRASTIDLVTNSDILGVARVVGVMALLVWLALFIDAWRLSILPNMAWWRTGILTLCNVLVVATATSVGYVGWTTASASKRVVDEVFTAMKENPPLEGRYNILLLGSDSSSNRTGMRPDSITVVSLDATTGVPVMVSLPRNLQNVPFPDDSPMKQVYPWGFNCGSECLLNAVHTYTADRTDLYPGADDPGMEATIDAVAGATGLNINYFIRVNMKGFSKLVDAVGGIEMDLSEPIAMFGSEDAWKNEYIPAGLQRLTGREALWYGRSRVQADDFARMGRQKCLLQAMVKQLSPQQVLLNASKIAESSADMVSTDIPATELGSFGDLGLKAKDQAIASLSVVPPKYSTSAPDFEEIHADIAALISMSEQRAKDRANGVKRPKPRPTPTDSLETPATPGPGEPSTPAEDSNNTEDLSSVC